MGNFIPLYSDYEADNIFAKVIRGEIPKYLVYENDSLLVIMDIMPQAPGHSLVISKEVARNIVDVKENNWTLLMEMARKVARAAARAFAAQGIVISQFNGSAAGQTIPHIHVHIVPCNNSSQAVHKQEERKIVSGEELEQQASQLRAELMQELI